VKPVSFRYEAPTTVREATALLKDAGYQGKALAGGQSLVPMMNFRLARPGVVVDLNGIKSLYGIRVGAEAIEIGALTRHQTIADSDELAVALPILGEAARNIGHWGVRNRGTIGGSLAHADPAAEWPAVLAALDAVVTVTGAEGSRTVTVPDLVTGPLTASLEPDEIIEKIRVPRPGQGVRFGLAEVTRRPGDFALVGAVVKVDQGTAIWTWFGLGGAPLARSLGGVDTEPGTIRDRVLALTEELPAVTDLQASDSWRRQVAAVVAERALVSAVEGRTR
jgi:carbon-monoxide dehydrogenase medium subunit